MTPSEEMKTAAITMRGLNGRAAEPIADLLDAMATWAHEYPAMAHDHDRPACADYACDVMGRAIAAARAINGGEQP